MTQTTNDQIEKIRDEILDAVQKSSKRRAGLVVAGKIKNTESLKIGKSEKQLQMKADELNRILLHKIADGMQFDSQKIVTATKKVNTAIDKLQDANRFISILTTFIDVLSTVISAVQSSNPLNLANLLDPLENLNT